MSILLIYLQNYSGQYYIIHLIQYDVFFLVFNIWILFVLPDFLHEFWQKDTMVVSIEEIKKQIESGERWILLNGKYIPLLLFYKHFHYCLFQENGIDGEGAKAIAELLKGNNSIERLDLSSKWHKAFHLNYIYNK